MKRIEDMTRDEILAMAEKIAERHAKQRAYHKQHQGEKTRNSFIDMLVKDPKAVLTRRKDYDLLELYREHIEKRGIVIEDLPKLNDL